MTTKEKLTKADLSRIIGGNIRKLRVDAGLSQDELAERLELSKNFVSLMETGAKFPSAETIVKLCNIFSIEFFELFFDSSRFISVDVKNSIASAISAQIGDSIAEIIGNLKIFKT